MAYLRVSTEEQTLGMEAQRTAITAWAQRQGVRKSRLSQEQGVQLRASASAGEKKAVLAREFNISREALYQNLRVW